MNPLLNSKGITLVEVVMAMMIGTVSIAGMLSTNTILQKSSGTVYQRVIAMQDANQVVERMRDSAALGLFPQNVQTSFPNNAAVGGFSNLNSELVTVSYTGADPLNVAVNVQWRDDDQRVMNYSINTLLTQRE